MMRLSMKREAATFVRWQEAKKKAELAMLKAELAAARHSAAAKRAHADAEEELAEADYRQRVMDLMDVPRLDRTAA